MATTDINLGLVAAATGTNNAITATFNPPFTALTDKMKVWVVAGGSSNTITGVTFAPDGLAAKTIQKNGGQNLSPGDIQGGMVMSLEYNGTGQVWELLNPAVTSTNLGVILNASTAKTTPVDADIFWIDDSAAGFILKKLTWANIKATLKTYFDAFYVPLTRTITINGDAKDLTADRSWTITTGGYTYVATSTTPYAASSGEYVNVDASGGNKVVTPPASGFFAVRMSAGSGSNTVTITGLDVLYIVGDVVEYIWNGAAFIRVSDGRRLHSATIVRAAAQTIANITSTKILFDTVTRNYGALTDIANNRIIIRRTGSYLLISKMLLFMSTTSYVQTTIYINGAQLDDRYEGAGGGGDATANNTLIYDLTAGDIIEFYSYHNFGGNRDTQTATYLRPFLTVSEIRLT